MFRRLVDVLFAVFWLVATAPLGLLCALWIRLDSPGPVLYTPLMLGQNGRPFRLLRFRTMRVDLPPGTAAEQRLTRAGRCLRNVSLDHLPMLANLLVGDLTLAGPRPMEPGAVDLADPAWQRYFQERPGLVNYAVVRLGRTWTALNSTRPALNRALELEYLRKRSPASDLRLVLKAAAGLVRSRGNLKARGEPEIDIPTPKGT